MGRSGWVAQAAAAVIVHAVCGGASLSRALPYYLQQTREEERPTAQALAYGVLRHIELLEALLAELLTKPLKRKDAIITSYLYIGLFELIEGRRPDYAIVNTIVQLVKSERRWAVGLSNALLRRFVRESTALLARARASSAAAQHLLPPWLLDRLQTTYPAQWERIADTLSSQAPMVLRVNLHRISRDDYADLCQQAGLAVEPHSEVASALILQQPVDVAQLPGFHKGLVSVQDAAAQFAAWCLQPKPQERILDACAAPGGKTVHLLEMTGGRAELYAIEAASERIPRLQENIARSGYSAELLQADAGALESWWDGQTFDRILLDAPCSATGVIRRHPDIKLHRKPEDIVALVALQRRLLDALWRTLKPGGRLVYATCSILPEENSEQTQAFLERTADAYLAEDCQTPSGAAMLGWQILPGDAEMDGFYYACLKKVAT